MTWRDQLRQGSFRGIPFQWRASEAEVGRRTEIHEFPGREQPPYGEDLGRRSRAFALSVLAIGDDYHESRQALVDAFEASGTAQLVHPLWGEMTVVVDGPVRIVESDATGGMAEIRVSVVEVGQAQAPGRSTDTRSATHSAADSLNGAAAASFVESFATRGQPERVRVDAAARLQGVASALRAARGRVAAGILAVDDLGQGVDQLGQEAALLVRQPGSLASSVTSVVGKLFAAVGRVEDAAQSSVGALLSGLELLGGSEEADLGSSREALNAIALRTLTRAVAVSEATRAASLLTYDSADQALGALSGLSGHIDAVLPAVSDEVYQSLRDLRVAIHEHLTRTAAKLPVLSSYEVLAPLPALVIAQTLYGDAEREAEIVRRNNLPNPAMIAAGTILEVTRA